MQKAEFTRKLQAEGRIVVIVALVKWMWGSRGFAAHGQEKPALDVLKECYARGGVDKEEFEQEKRDLAG